MICERDSGIQYEDNDRKTHLIRLNISSRAYCNSFANGLGCSKKETCLVFKELPEPTIEQVSTD